MGGVYGEAEWEGGEMTDLSGVLKKHLHDWGCVCVSGVVVGVF